MKRFSGLHSDARFSQAWTDTQCLKIVENSAEWALSDKQFLVKSRGIQTKKSSIGMI